MPIANLINIQELNNAADETEGFWEITRDLNKNYVVKIFRGPISRDSPFFEALSQNIDKAIVDVLEQNEKMDKQ